MTNDGNYQDTFCDWVGEIPKDWNMTRGRFLFNSKKEINRELQCEKLLSLTLNGVLNKDYLSSEGLRPENYNTYQIFQKDDLVFKMIDLENIKTSRVGLVHEEGIMSPVYIRHEPIKEKINPKFAYWFYYDLYKKEIYNSIGSGVRSSLSSSDLLEIELPVPPIEEQKLISRYLDKKTSQLDSLVERIRKKIELLKEQRTSLINHYVTKGLDPNVKMKDSGIDWIGEIPKHWELQKGKYILKILSTRVVGDETDGEGVPLIKVDDLNYVSDGYFLTKSKSTVHPGNPNILLPKGILIFPKRGMTIFTNKIVISDINGLLDPNLMGIQVGQSILTKFLFHLIKNRGLGDICDQTTVPQINNKHIYPLEFQVPPLEEQHYIIDLIDTKSHNTNSIINGENKRIDLLKEYRQSLISSVVTGKVRVTEDMI